MLIAAAGMWWLGKLTIQSTYAHDVAVPLFALGFGLGLTYAHAISAATAAIDERNAGVASAMVNTSQQIGGSVGTAALSTVFSVVNLTFVATWAGVAYVCFITDAFSRMIVGWRVASHMRTTLVLDAIEMARWSRGIALPSLRRRRGSSRARRGPARMGALAQQRQAAQLPRRPTTAEFEAAFYDAQRTGQTSAIHVVAAIQRLI